MRVKLGENIYHLYFREEANIHNLQRIKDSKYQENKTVNQQMN